MNGTVPPSSSNSITLASPLTGTFRVFAMCRRTFCDKLMASDIQGENLVVATRPFAPTAHTEPPDAARALYDSESKLRQDLAPDMSEPEVPVATHCLRFRSQIAAER